MEVHHTVLYIFPMILLRKKIVLQSTALCDHFLYSRDLNVLFRVVLLGEIRCLFLLGVTDLRTEQREICNFHLSSTWTHKIYFIAKRFQNRHSLVEVSLRKEREKNSFALDFNQNTVFTPPWKLKIVNSLYQLPQMLRRLGDQLHVIFHSWGLSHSWSGNMKYSSVRLGKGNV